MTSEGSEASITRIFPAFLANRIKPASRISKTIQVLLRRAAFMKKRDLFKLSQFGLLRLPAVFCKPKHRVLHAKIAFSCCRSRRCSGDCHDDFLSRRRVG